MNAELQYPILTPLDRQVAQVIMCARGARQAITIKQITVEIWPGSPYPAAFQPLARVIKASVRRLRRAGLKIGSARGSRGNPPGYYMIETARELAMTVKPLLDQALDELKTIEALTGNQYYVRELTGQRKLFEQVVAPASGREF